MPSSVQVGDENVISDSFNTTNIMSPIESQIQIIKREFFEGNIGRSFSDIKVTQKEHSSNEKARFQLLVLETQFYFALRDFDKAIEIFTYIEQNLAKYADVSFYEIKASLLSINNKKVEFDNVVTKLRMEFHNENPLDYYEILFLLNSMATNDAAKLFNDTIKKYSENRHFQYLGGMIYSNLYYETKSQEDFIKAKSYYQKYIEMKEPDFFEKLEIYKFFSIEVVNELLIYSDIDYRDIVDKTKNLLEKIYDDLDFFGVLHQTNLLNHYLHCLFFLDKPKFSAIFRSRDSNIIDLVNFIFFHFELDDSSIKISEIELRIISMQEVSLLISYLNYLLRHDPKHVVDFLTENNHFLSNDIVQNIFFEAKIFEDKIIDEHELQIIEINKNNSVVSTITYLECQQFLNQKLQESQIQELMDLFDKYADQEILILKAIRLLYFNNRQKEYLELSLKFHSTHHNICRETLKLIYSDKNILLSDFEKYISHIETIPHSVLIGNIYFLYRIFSKAYHFYMLAWKNLSFIEQTKIDLASSILQNCTIQYYMINYGNILNTDQDKVLKSYLEGVSDKLNLEQLAVLSYYLIVIEKAYESGFEYINKKLLSLDIAEINSTEKEMLSNLYFYLITNKIAENQTINSNILISHNNQYYLDKERYPCINLSHSIIQKERIEFELILRQYEHLSIFNYICNKFIFSMQSEHFFTVESSSEDPLAGIAEMMHTRAHSDKNTLERYSEGEIISFYNLTHKNYESYFGLIPTLLESSSINFHSCHNNFVPTETKKILTLSSIIFLDHIGRLDYVLSKKDVFIQKTTIDWLFHFIASLDKTDEILRIHSDGTELYKNLSDRDTIQRSQKYLVDLATKITQIQQVIDDREEVLEIKESYDMLAPHIGHQEYKALAFSYKYNYQIISEDRIFEMLFSQFRFNLSMLSNSMSLLGAYTEESSELLDLHKSLYNKKYSYLLNEILVRKIIDMLVFEHITYITGDNFSEMMKFVVKIAYSYGWTDNIEQYYENNYVFKLPMSSISNKNYISRNIEYLKELSNK